MFALPTFLGLPVELRLRVYEWTFADSHVHMAGNPTKLRKLATEAQVLLLSKQIRDEALKRFHVSLILDHDHHLVMRQNDHGLPDFVRRKIDTIMFCMKGCWDEDDVLRPDRFPNLQHFVVFDTLPKFLSFANWKDKHLHAPASEQDEAH